VRKICAGSKKNSYQTRSGRSHQLRFCSPERFAVNPITSAFHVEQFSNTRAERTLRETSRLPIARSTNELVRAVRDV